MAKPMRHCLTGPKHDVMSAARACARCGQPDDLSASQQADVVRSLAQRYARLFDRADPAALAAPAPEPGSWSAVEHATYVGVLLGTIDLRLALLLGVQNVVSAESTCSLGSQSVGEVQHVAYRLCNHAERLTRTIAAGADRNWQAACRPGGTSPHDLVHWAIDEATEHLNDAERAAHRNGASISSKPCLQRRGGGREDQDRPALANTGFSGIQSEEDGTTVVSLRGELDMATAPDVRVALEVAMEAEPLTVVIDLQGLNFADLRGVREFARASRRARIGGRRLRLRAPSAAVRKVLRLTGMEQLLAVEAEHHDSGSEASATRCQPQKIR